MSWPSQISLTIPNETIATAVFWEVWRELMEQECHRHPVWDDKFFVDLGNHHSLAGKRFQLAATWATNMVVGSYCFPRYVAALAARAEHDGVRHLLLGNAWDESGGQGHTIRSHFWLAVRLAELLGLSQAQISRIKPLPAAQFYTDQHALQCQYGSFGFALGMICLIEEYTGPEFTLIRDGLLEVCAVAGLSRDEFIERKGAEYFNANIEDDERHRREMPTLTAVWLFEQGVNLDSREAIAEGLTEVAAGIRYSADLRQRFFTDIHQFIEGGRIYTDLTD